LGLPLNKQIVLLMGGGKGWGIERIIRALARSVPGVFAVVIAGSEDRKAHLAKLASGLDSESTTLEITGFTEATLYFAAADLLISKTGGMTTTEAFLTRLPLLPVLP